MEHRRAPLSERRARDPRRVHRGYAIQMSRSGSKRGREFRVAQDELHGPTRCFPRVGESELSRSASITSRISRARSRSSALAGSRSVRSDRRDSTDAKQRCSGNYGHELFKEHFWAGFEAPVERVVSTRVRAELTQIGGWRSVERAGWRIDYRTNTYAQVVNESPAFVRRLDQQRQPYEVPGDAG